MPESENQPKGGLENQIEALNHANEWAKLTGSEVHTIPEALELLKKTKTKIERAILEAEEYQLHHGPKE